MNKTVRIMQVSNGYVLQLLDFSSVRIEDTAVFKTFAELTDYLFTLFGEEKA